MKFAPAGSPPASTLFALAILAAADPGSSQENGRGKGKGQAKASLETLFTRADTNGDGKLTPAEAPGQRRLIKGADRDSSGDATLAEIRTHLEERRSATEPDPDLPGKTIVVEKFPAGDGVPFTKTSCDRAAAYSAKANGHAVVVMHDGEICYQRYDNGWAPGKGHRLASGTKSFSAAILCAAEKDGLLTLDEPVSGTITEWKRDDRLAAITIRDLLSLTSGIDPGVSGQPVPDYEAAVARERPRFERGEKFAYGPVPFQVFGELMRRKLRTDERFEFESPLAYLEAKALEPIGMDYTDWRHAGEDEPSLPSGAFVTATDWIRFGEYLRGGAGNPEILAECLEGSPANPKYGLTIWLLRDLERPEFEGAYMAAGAGKQRLYVIPKMETVVVRFGESNRQFLDRVFLARLFPAGK